MFKDEIVFFFVVFFSPLFRPAELFCSWWMCFYLCCRWTLRTGWWVEGWQVWGWSRRRYASSSTLSSSYHASSRKPWTTTSASSSQVSTHTHTCTGVETYHSSLPSVLHTLTHPCLIDVRHHWSILFLPSGCSNTCFLKSVKIFLNLDEPMAHYITGWHGNHKEFNDSASLAHGFLTFSFQGPPRIMFFLRGTSFRKYWQLHLYCVI